MSKNTEKKTKEKKTKAAPKKKEGKRKPPAIRSFADPSKTIDGEPAEAPETPVATTELVTTGTEESRFTARCSFRPGGLGVKVDEEATIEDVFQGLRFVAGLNKGTLFGIGDLLLFAEAKFGEMASQLEDEGILDYQTCANAKWVAKTFPPESRIPTLKFSHHKAAAALKPGKREEVLQLANENKWSVPDIEAEVKKIKEQNPEEYPKGRGRPKKPEGTEQAESSPQGEKIEETEELISGTPFSYSFSYPGATEAAAKIIEFLEEHFEDLTAEQKQEWWNLGDKIATLVKVVA